MRAARGIAAGLAGLILAGGTIAVTAPWTEPGSKARARTASADPFWDHTIAGLSRRSQWTLLAQRSWVPWARRCTAVGTHYDATGNAEMLLDALTRHAATSGWAVERREAVLGPRQRLAKQLRSGPASLELRKQPSGDILTAVIRVPPECR